MSSNNLLFSPVEQAVLQTLLYSDIFSFPLSRDELWKLLISDKKVTKKQFSEALQNLSGEMTYQGGYFCIKGREAIIAQRKKNLPEVQKKIRVAKKTAFYLSHIPTVQFIGISGGVAVENADADDDIDFFVITKKGTLFMTRFWILCLLEWKNLRRKRTDTAAPNKICVNLLIDESNLSWPVKKRDLYIAHEIVQLKSLFERNDTYQAFMESNRWVKKFLPNALDEKSLFQRVPWRTHYQTLRFISFLFFRQPFEGMLQKVQQKYMRRYHTREVITKTVLAFHPNDYGSKTMADLRTKCQKLGLLTKF